MPKISLVLHLVLCNTGRASCTIGRAVHHHAYPSSTEPFEQVLRVLRDKTERMPRWIADWQCTKRVLLCCDLRSRWDDWAVAADVI
jgi:hypothetical protein